MKQGRYKKMLKRLDRLTKELPKEDYHRALFPSKENLKEFELMTEYLKGHAEFFKQSEDGKRRIEIMKAFFNKLKADKLHDQMLDRLLDDGYLESKKQDSQDLTYENYLKKRNSEDVKEKLDVTCKFYAAAFERTYRKYFKPIASKIAKKKINFCSSAIDTIVKYDENTKLILGVFIPHIRNSIDHNDWYYDNQKQVVVFADRDKPPLELPVEHLQNLCAWEMFNELCISAADTEIKKPFWKAIVEESKKVAQYCEILDIDQDALLEHFLPRGISLFQLRWMLEQILKRK